MPRSGFVVLALVLIGCPLPIGAQTATVEEVVRGWYEAWGDNDLERIAALDAAGVGFGARTRTARAASTPEQYRRGAAAFLGAMEYYRLRIDELQTIMDGDIGLAWGVHTEEFKRKGREPEKMTVRFSMALKRAGGTWTLLLYHRDAQIFDDAGYYIPTVQHAQPTH